uniref:Uncharacterized protein n=1 Tax=Cacopsylla melanoneura TaxID=428564 RepID=A0A8D8V7Q7_9HEMI
MWTILFLNTEKIIKMTTLPETQNLNIETMLFPDKLVNQYMRTMVSQNITPLRNTKKPTQLLRMKTMKLLNILMPQQNMIPILDLRKHKPSRHISEKTQIKYNLKLSKEYNLLSTQLVMQM